MEGFGNQLKQVVRRLLRTPMFAVITLITLAAAVGANTVVFSVLEGILLKPLPYPHPEELVGVWHKAPGINLPMLEACPSMYFVYREQSQTFQDVGLYRGDSFSVTGVGDPEQVRGFLVTESVLPILGAKPVLGRLFSHEDNLPGTPETVLISYGYWRSKFGGSSSVIGRSIVADGKSREIIGVLPQDFRPLEVDDPALVVPYKFDRNKITLGNFSYRAVARLKPGVSMAQADADVARMIPLTLTAFPAPQGFSIKLFEEAHISPNLHPLKQDVVGDIGNVLWVLMGSIGVVLLIACANVANLLLVRVEGRKQELALRAALGAGRGRIAGELLIESLILGLIGSVLGLGLAYVMLRVLVAIAPTGLPRIHEIGIDLPVLLFTLVISLLASLLFGAIPVLKYAGAHLNTGLREGGRALSQSREQHRARSVLVVVQVSLALVLLICSGLMIRTFRALTHVQAGFTEPASVQTFHLYIPESEVKDPEQVVRMYQEMSRKIAAIPGVSSVGISTSVPMDGNHNNDPVFAQDHTYSEGELPPLRRFRSITPGYLETMGTSLVAGRDFTWTDTYNRLPVTLISENFAREYWHSASDAIGKRIRVGNNDDWREIVGVVADIYDDGVNQEPPASAYWPIWLDRFEGAATQVRREVLFAIRSPRTGSESFMKEVRQAVWSLDPNLPLYDVHSEDHYYKNSMARTSFTLVMLAVAGGMALLLGVVGIYGVIAYTISQRTREIGIRMAIGARSEQLTGMFVRHGMLLTGIGVVCGLAAAVVVMRLMSSLLFRVSPVDPLTYVAVSLVLVVTAFLASYLPSRRAAAVDPVDALRAE